MFYNVIFGDQIDNRVILVVAFGRSRDLQMMLLFENEYSLTDGNNGNTYG